MPESHTTQRAIAEYEYGAYYILAPLWVPNDRLAGYPFGFFANVKGLRFQLAADMAAEKPRTRTMTLIVLATTYLGAPATLEDTYVSIQNTPVTESFSLANPPDSTLEIGGILPGWGIVGNITAAEWSMPTTPAVASIPLGTLSTDPVTGTTYYDLTQWAPLLESANANGILNLSLQIYTGAEAANVITALVVEELDFFTGVAGSMGRERGDARVRVVRDSRYGMPAWSDNLVEDEFIEGNWVRAHDRDPEDEYREYVPNPREGVRDDDVPLE